MSWQYSGSGKGVLIDIPSKAIKDIGNQLQSLVGKRLSHKRRIEIEEYILAKSTEFVPERTGKLVSSGYIDDNDSLRWNATNEKGYNYAGIQYNQPFSHSKPLATDHWVDATMQYYRDDIAHKVVEVFTRNDK